MARIRSFSKGCSYALSGLVHIGPLTQGSAFRLHPGLNAYAASRLRHAQAFSRLRKRADAEVAPTHSLWLFRYIRRSRKKQFGQASSTLRPYDGGNRFSPSRGEFGQPWAVACPDPPKMGTDSLFRLTVSCIPSMPAESENGVSHPFSLGEFAQPCAVPERIFELTNHALA